MKKLFAGIDLGTSGCRLNIIDEDKNLHESASLSYANPDDQSPELWWESVKTLLKNLSPKITIYLHEELDIDVGNFSAEFLLDFLVRRSTLIFTTEALKTL